jgi:uroporphyrinogen decarboxylase
MEYFPNDIIMGNITPSIIQAGTAEQVYEEAKKCLEKGKRAASGFMLAPGCELPAKAPPYNVWTIMRCIDDHGRYD